MSRPQIITLLILAAVVDTVIPIPFFAAIAIYVVVKRPPEFLDWVKRLYVRG